MIPTPMHLARSLLARTSARWPSADQRRTRRMLRLQELSHLCPDVRREAQGQRGGQQDFGQQPQQDRLERHRQWFGRSCRGGAHHGHLLRLRYGPGARSGGLQQRYPRRASEVLEKRRRERRERRHAASGRACLRGLRSRRERSARACGLRQHGCWKRATAFILADRKRICE